METHNLDLKKLDKIHIDFHLAIDDKPLIECVATPADIK
jgi:hypothetical protein